MDEGSVGAPSSSTKCTRRPSGEMAEGNGSATVELVRLRRREAARIFGSLRRSCSVAGSLSLRTRRERHSSPSSCRTFVIDLSTGLAFKKRLFSKAHSAARNASVHNSCPCSLQLKFFYVVFQLIPLSRCAWLVLLYPHQGIFSPAGTISRWKQYIGAQWLPTRVSSGERPDRSLRLDSEWFKPTVRREHRRRHIRSSKPQPSQ